MPVLYYRDPADGVYKALQAGPSAYEPYISVYRGSTGQTISPSTNTTIVWDGVEEQSGFNWSSGANVTIPKSGIYHMEAVLAVTTGPTAGQLIHFGAYRNGAEDVMSRQPAPAQQSPNAYIFSTDIRCITNDTMALFVFVGTGTTTTFSPVTNRRLRTMMSLRWVHV